MSRKVCLFSVDELLLSQGTEREEPLSALWNGAQSSNATLVEQRPEHFQRLLTTAVVNSGWNLRLF